MCPEFRRGVCEIAGIEPDEIECTSKDCCPSNDWEEYSVYILQFFIHPDEKLATAA